MNYFRPVILIALLLPQVLPAQIVTAHFSGYLTQISTWDGNTSTLVYDVGSADLFGWHLQEGYTFTGSFSYDASTPISPYDSNGTADGIAVFMPTTGSYSVEIPAIGFSAQTINPALTVSNNYGSGGSDSFGLFPTWSLPDGNFVSSEVFFYDGTGSMYDGFDLPTNLPLGALTALPSFRLTLLESATRDQIIARGTVSSLTVVAGSISSVPEPSTCVAGIFLVGAIATRRWRARRRPPVVARTSPPQINR